ncbi:MAG: 3-beta hydroxysteroid dehydrogenase [Candidatus Lambdaproteobacteria bacterium RIFOXYD1_FULL_56_27]|uniref:3-beta hydroxysteroid dehydrogenase n=1 Tax=Candidatus Lambdaproteobacteria bacterium RIFOXYD2_FULL_56_26 TaxID=1817773 RepID=A0A1F6GNU3_9PROT|nr:MAG: 3-beta hydroxysteroid dehydrogenase [Candidatus Lambdaproteobacteria bacterium RIFOXYD2_FULL_56_26]OGG99868.1 MAG: 3-beta hydroxysteroid dehydrogenase [Candidatus Lambdaproteobacteria bacterium RIFOXYC1_FULL_56_13]OGH09683.1 MAG: 3-beta hydroxysteroid dehydrogenase [Candidatus Lambdaproteobacteria bacterium RIFOXYD1_FULL_56_27]
MRNFLITGGCGFVGSSLALSLKAKDPTRRVLALDNLKRRGSELNLPRLKAAGVEFVHGDIRNQEDLEAVGEVDLLLECSAEPSVLAGLTGSPAYVINTNLMGTLNCLELARQRNAAFLFFSTSRVYPMAGLGEVKLTERTTRFELDEVQDQPGLSGKGVSESYGLEGARSIYGATKLASELMIHEYVEAFGLKALINRCGVLTGPWQFGKQDQGVVVLWAARHHFEGKLGYFGYGGEGKQVRDILHVQDLYRLVELQLGRLDQWRGQVYNVGGGREVSVSLAELTALCQAATGKKIPLGSVPENRVADIPLYLTDNSKVTAATGWRPQIGPEQIVNEIALWIKNNETLLAGVLQ